MPNYFNPYMPTYMQQPQMLQQAPMQAPQRNPYESSFVWVDGPASAENYLVAAGGKVYLMTTDLTKLFVKATDPSGKPMPMEVYTLTREGAEPPRQYVTMEEFEKRMQELTAKISRKVQSGDLSPAEWELVFKAAKGYKDLLTAMAMTGEDATGEYSERMYDDRYYRRGDRYSNGTRSMDRGYSRTGGRDALARQIESMIRQYNDDMR